MGFRSGQASHAGSAMRGIFLLYRAYKQRMAGIPELYVIILKTAGLHSAGESAKH